MGSFIFFGKADTEVIRIELTGEMAAFFDVYNKVHAGNNDWPLRMVAIIIGHRYLRIDL